MSDNEIYIVTTLIKGLAYLFGLLTAFFMFWGTWREDKQGSINEWFKERWTEINASSWLQLPEKVIYQLIRIKSQAVKALAIFSSNKKLRFAVLGGDIMAFVLGCLMLVRRETISIIMMLIIIIIFGSLIAMILATVFRSPPKELNKLLFFNLGLVNLAAAIVWTSILLDKNIYVSTFLMVILLPLYWGMIVHPFTTFPAILWADQAVRWGAFRMKKGRAGEEEYWKEYWTEYQRVKQRMEGRNRSPKQRENAERKLQRLERRRGMHKMIWTFTLFGTSVSLSFLVTFIALALGHAAEPIAWVPQRIQMLVSNVIFDGLTMVVTFEILERAVGGAEWYRIPCAVLLDSIVAALFACLSLYVGLAFSDHALTIQETLNILVGNSADGAKLQLGPYFWAMHTAFLPTLFYLVLILISWIGKSILSIFRMFLGRGFEHRRPLTLTSALLGLVAALLFFGAWCVEIFVKHG